MDHRILLMTGLLLNAAATEAQLSPPASADPLAAASLFMSRLDAGQYDSAVELGTPDLRAALPASKLSEVWTALPQQVGPCGPRGPLRSEQRDGHDLIVSTLACAKLPLELRIAVATDGAIAGFFVAPAPARESVEVAASAKYSEKETRIGNPASSLPGTLSIPNGKGRFPAVVLVHGSGPHDRDETLGPNKPFADIARGLAERGIVVLRYDKRTRVRPEDFSEKSFDVNSEVVDDAVAAVALLSDHAQVDAQRIVVVGHSLGGYMAPRIVQRAPRIAGMALLAAPTRGLHEIVPEQVHYIAALDGKVDATEQSQLDALEKQRDEIRRLDVKHPPAKALMLGLPAAYWADLRDYEPVATARSLAQPILILQGGRDYQVRSESEFARWKQSFGDQTRARLIEYPTLSHLFQTGGTRPGPDDYARAGHVDDRVINDLASWILEVTAASRRPK